MNLPPVLRQSYTDSNGNPLAGGKIYSYAAGTSTPQATYTDSGGGTPNANPLVLDANGEAAMWLDPTLSYKFVLKNSADVTQWTIDNVVGIISNNSVVTASIADGAVTAAKLATGAVTGAAGGGKLAASAINGQTAETVPAIGDELMIYDLSATALRKMTFGNFVTPIIVTKAFADSGYTVADDVDVVLCNAASGSMTINLPTAVGRKKPVQLIKIDSTYTGIVTIDANATETINGALTKKLATPFESLLLASDGANWVILERRIPSEWVTATMAINLSSNVSATGKTRRVGDCLEVQVLIQFSGVNTQAASVQVTIPHGLTIDTAKIMSTAAGRMMFGQCDVRDDSAGNNLIGGSWAYNSSTTVVGQYLLTGAASSAMNAQTINPSGNLPMVIDNLDQIYGWFRVPITNWEG